MKKNREIDGYYFRVKRDKLWYNICFTDLTELEARRQLLGRSNEWLKSLHDGLYEITKEILYMILDPEDKLECTDMLVEIFELEDVSERIILLYKIIRKLAVKFDIRGNVDD